MCGINGILRLRDNAGPIDQRELVRTRDHMTNRGPDGKGAWMSPGGEIALGHRRLAIIDLTSAGVQPMSSGDGRYHIVFNGEIYNYRELRQELMRDGVAFQSHSDTEVILALYAREGIAVLPRLRGMYALAVWDELERRLLLARDPYGIKPLYYTVNGGYLRFASQVKALEASWAISREVDTAGLIGFLLWGSVPEPFTIRKAIRSLPAGHYLSVANCCVGDPRPYHSFGQFPFPCQPTVASALRDTVQAHLVSDVPVAVFLSAGLDSSLLAALACRCLPEPPVTFTLGFDSFAGTPLDEAPLAAEVANALGTQHIECRVKREEFLGLWPQALDAMDQPSIDGFNTFVISKIAHEAGLKVVLSGLGGDELFGSYPSFADVPKWSKWAQIGRHVPGLSSVWPHVAHSIRPKQPRLAGLLRYGNRLPGAYFLRRGLFLPEELPDLVGQTTAEKGLAAYDPVLDIERRLENVIAANGPNANGAWLFVHIMESIQYMRNQLLRDVDWASMAHSLELRVPLVDAWLREQVAAANFEPARSQGKAAVVRQAAPELPDSLWQRPKSGFWIPVAEWLQEPSQAKEARHRGLDARQLAVRVLDELGIQLGGNKLHG